MLATNRFLLYIDILAFSQMTHTEPRKVARAYSILDSLNVHKHSAFKTIVFSDTVLVYNAAPVATSEERDYLVWYLIEFAEDLQHRFTGQDIYFRAVITTGSFSHYQLKNIECFYGEALINAYQREKTIPSIGLFIDSACNAHNKYFRTAPFDEHVHFVYLNRDLEYLDQYAAGVYPCVDPALEDQAPHMPWQVRFLRDVYSQMRLNPDPAVRTKYLNAWDFYSRRYPAMLHELAQSNFSLSALAGRTAWETESEVMLKDIKSFRRIGSGTTLSKQISAGATAELKRGLKSK